MINDESKRRALWMSKDQKELVMSRIANAHERLCRWHRAWFVWPCQHGRCRYGRRRSWSRRRSMQPLVQCLQSQGPSALCFGACLACLSASTVGVHDAGQPTFYSCAGLLISRVNVLGGEGSADFQRHQGVVDLIGDGADRSVQGLWEEVGEGKSVGGIAFDDGAVAGGSRGQRGADAVEAEVDPSSQEAEPGEEHGGLGAQDKAGQGVCEEENGGEMLDAHADDALCDCNSVLGNELLEGDKEGSLNGNAAGDGGGEGAFVPGENIADGIEQEAQQIGQ